MEVGSGLRKYALQASKEMGLHGDINAEVMKKAQLLLNEAGRREDIFLMEERERRVKLALMIKT